ncbi:cadherin-like domain-containing protein, partial [Thalassospira sp. HF15]|uniref:Ig-like domain-containing protein n=1 Tax=Thalassospira sp. HF15 TaxID=2722755 RepID=UPI001431AB82
VDGDGLSFELVDGPANGSVTINADGSYSFTASEGYVGEDSFTYRVTDEHGLSSEGVMSVNIQSPSRPGDSIEKTSGGAGWNAGAYSEESIVGAGLLTTIVSAKAANRMVGLSSSPTDSGYATIEYGIYLIEEGWFRVFENGADLGRYGDYQPGDTLTINRDENGVVTYSHNGAVVYTSTTVSSTSTPLYADIAIMDEGGTVGDVSLSLAGEVAQAVTWIADPNLTYIAGDQVFDGTSGNDVLAATTIRSSILNGGAGDDILISGAADDTLAGGDGADKAIFSGNRDDYLIEDNGDGTLTVRDTNASDGDDG